MDEDMHKNGKPGHKHNRDEKRTTGTKRHNRRHRLCDESRLRIKCTTGFSWCVCACVCVGVGVGVGVGAGAGVGVGAGVRRFIGAGGKQGLGAPLQS